jgi:hypothetical protein
MAVEQFTEVVLKLGPQAGWYEDLSVRRRSRLARSVIRIAEQVFDNLTDHIEMPERVYIGFIDGDEYALVPSAGNLLFTEEGIDLLGDSKQCFRGLVGHEASHLSDHSTDNDCSINYSSCQLSKVVSEGKAESVGLEIGGRAYDWMCSELTDDERPSVYRSFLFADDQQRKAIVREHDVEAVGLSMVQDVLRANNAEILSLHRQPVSFYETSLSQIVSSLQTALQPVESPVQQPGVVVI